MRQRWDFGRMVAANVNGRQSGANQEGRHAGHFDRLLQNNVSLRYSAAGKLCTNDAIRSCLMAINRLPAQYWNPVNVENVMPDVRKLRKITWNIKRLDGSREISHLYSVAIPAMWELAHKGKLTAERALAFLHHDSLENGYVPEEKLRSRLNGSFGIVARLSHRHGITLPEYAREYMDAVFDNGYSVVAKRHDSRANLSTLAYIIKPNAKLAERGLGKGIIFHMHLVEEGMATRKDREILHALENTRPDSIESLLELSYVVHRKGTVKGNGGQKQAMVFQMPTNPSHAQSLDAAEKK